MRGIGPAAWMTMALLAGGPSATAGPLVRVWAETRVEVHGRSATDEAGAQWLDVEGRVRTDRGEPVGRATVRFERRGGDRQVRTEADGRFRTRLRRVPGDPWVAHYDGAERLRPSASPVAVEPPEPASRFGWLLLAMPAAGVAGLAAAFGAARAFRRLCDHLRSSRRRLRPSSRGAETPGAGGGIPPGERRIRLVDRLRDHPLPQGWCRSPFAAETPIHCDAAGSVSLPPVAEDWMVGAPGYLPEPLAAECEHGTVRLLRGRDAVTGVLERTRGAAIPTEQPTVLALAHGVVPPDEATRLGRLCYGPPGPPPAGTDGLLDHLWTVAASEREQESRTEPACRNASRPRRGPEGTPGVFRGAATPDGDAQRRVRRREGLLLTLSAPVPYAEVIAALESESPDPPSTRPPG